MVSTTHLLEGDYPPLYHRGGNEDLIMDIISRFKISGVFLYNVAARVGSTSEILLNDRSFCNKIGVPILETGLDEAPDLLNICSTHAERSPIMVELTVGDFNMWMYLKVRSRISRLPSNPASR